MIRPKKFLIYILSLYLCSCASTSVKKTDYIKAGVKTKFFKVVTKGPQPKFVAVEYWAEFKDFIYLYADLLLQGKHLVIVQFIKFNSDLTVAKTRHFLITQDKTVIAGGVFVENDFVSIDDTFYGHQRKIKMPFKGKVLHPVKLTEFLNSQVDADLKKSRYTFIDWRSAYSQLDQFVVNKSKSDQYKIQMATGVSLILESRHDQVEKLHILFNGTSENPDSELLPSTQLELETKSAFNFDYVKSLDYLNWAEDFK